MQDTSTATPTDEEADGGVESTTDSELSSYSLVGYEQYSSVGNDLTGSFTQSGTDVDTTEDTATDSETDSDHEADAKAMAHRVPTRRPNTGPVPTSLS